MKVTQSKKKITAFGGLNFCHKLFEDSGLKAIIDEHLGPRAKNASFTYSDIFSTHMSVFLAGGDATEDANTHLRDTMNNVKRLSVCSADTILKAFKEVATATTSWKSDTGVHHEFNTNNELNTLLVKSLVKTNQLQKKKRYTLDYDNQVIPTEKYDAKNTYKGCKGYQSGIATIEDMIVGIEGRNGNSPASYQQDQTIERIFAVLAHEKVLIERFRADAASYQKEILDLLEQQGCSYYIRAKKCANMEQKIAEIKEEDWLSIRLGTQEMQVAEIEYHPFQRKQASRLVVSRIKQKNRQIGLFSGTAYSYRAIITNDRKKSCKQVVHFYNQRGNSERIFDVMNNDFGWSKLPFSFLDQNTAFMIVTALYANFYRFMITQFSDKLPWLKPTFRLKKFIFRFISVPAQWIKSGGRHILKLYTNKDYSPLVC